MRDRIAVPVGWRAAVHPRLRSIAVSEPAGEVLAIVLLCPILLSIAIWNGFPIVFYDTGAYILEGLGHVFVVERSPVYSFFLEYAGAASSVWYVVGAQALMTSFVLTEFARVETPRQSVGRLLAIAAGLCFFTGIAWYVGELEPDCFTALTVLATYLITFRAAALGSARVVALLLVDALAAASHTAHLGLLAGLLLAIVTMRVAGLFLRHAAFPKANVFLPAMSLALAFLFAVASNHDLTHKYFISKAGPGFIFARLLQDGIVKRELDAVCPAAHYRLCAYKDNLPTRADAWLWGSKSPFNTLDRANGLNQELTRIIDDSIRRYPTLNILAAIRDTEIQFFAFKTGDQIEPQEWLLRRDLRQFIPTQMNAYLDARQQRGEIQFHLINEIHVPVGGLSLLGLLLLFGQFAIRRDWTRASLAGFVLVALIGNAFICGVLSNPHDRYQSRLIWVPTFVLALLLQTEATLALRRPVESVT